MSFGLEAGSTVRKRLAYSAFGTSIYTANVLYADQDYPSLAPGVWHHAALTMQASTGYAFLNGQFVASTALPFGTFDMGNGFNWFRLEFGHSVFGLANPGQTVYVHGLRFEPRCKWTENFTPPLNN
jgi:hypothetical protein